MATGTRNRLNRSVDARYDHVLGPPGAPITLVEYGSYACPHCRAANDRIANVRDDLGDRLRYVFRHKPIPDNDLARRAAELVERTTDPIRFWDAHMELMSRSKTLTEEDLVVVAEKLDLEHQTPEDSERSELRAKKRVDADINSAQASGVLFTPTFFINGRRYDGAWDESSFSDAMFGRLGHRVAAAAVDFVSWGPSAGLLLLLATVLAVFLTNSEMGPEFLSLWQQKLTLSLGGASFGMSLLHWINDGLLTIFFLVVGLEIKREFTVGHLAGRKSAALPIAAALGGMIMPALIYALFVPSGPWVHGWGVPIATDTAFAVALIFMMGQRVPIELRIFLTAAAIVDDIAAIVVVAVFYSGELSFEYMAAAVVLTGGLALLSWARIYRVFPYMIIGLGLWICVLASGLHPTLAGVVLALFIPTRPPPNLKALMAQADSIMANEAQRNKEALRHGPSTMAMRTLEAIHDRLESPADRLLRHAGMRSSYLVLPIFALANAGVPLSMNVITGHETLMLAIISGLVIGKPVGMLSAAALAVCAGLAVKPAAYSWRQLAGAGALAGIGFTMSLFIAGQAFPVQADFAAAKIAVFAASILAATIGMALLITAPKPDIEEVDVSTAVKS
ncbi:Na+/H+ antiporter NhaA [Filomicrobium sp.]|uniref:Na+/H+ antiporter NhaA n=1 Tax=Filomicrobium sp. TaxID=2024831 RepID=UPI00258FFBAD|nr:Na+/H+ antiporter NhaA [Filomicrobium sp.]MCV0368537.1 Na+/H+ antiporter NhaA [Filomicrobium sp.]